MERKEYMRLLLQNRGLTLGANLKQKSQNRKEEFVLDRKTKKDLRDIGRRNIDVNMNPYNSSASKNVQLPVIKPSLNNDAVNKRLEMLAKWKADKAKTKALSTGSKPIFKVSTVRADPLTNIENANKFIKGKPIVSTTQKSQFAPDNYKFKAPSTIKNLATTLGVKTGSKSGAVPKIKPVKSKETAKSNSLKVVGCKTEGQTATLRRSDRIKCRMGMVKDSKETEAKPKTDNKTEESTSVSLRKQNIQNTAGRNRKLQKPDTAADAQNVLNATFTRNHEDEAASNIANLSGIEELHEISDIDYSTPASRRSITSKFTDKKKGFDRKFKSSTPVYPEEASNDLTFNLQEKPISREHRTPQNSKDVRKSSGNALSARKEPKNEIRKVSNGEGLNSTPVYISPFVTISRGKKNARDEYKIRRSLGEILPMNKTDIDVVSIVNTHTSPGAAADYFTVKLNASIQKINEMCEKWEKYIQDPALPEEASSSIIGTIGQSRLLISEKFEQFRKLIMQCKEQNSAKGYIRCDDLHGFWDMIYIQVEQLEKKFDHLHCLKENNWIEHLPEKKVVKKSSKVRAKKPVVKSRIKDIIRAAKEERNKTENNLTEECKHGEVKTPKSEPQILQAELQSSSKRRSARISLLAENPRHSSPGLVIMKLTQSIKRGDGLTPTRSILKMQTLKSTGKKSVTFRPSSTPGILTPTVLFRSEEKENTPRIVRRSRRFITDVQ